MKTPLTFDGRNEKKKKKKQQQSKALQDDKQFQRALLPCLKHLPVDEWTSIEPEANKRLNIDWKYVEHIADFQNF